MHVLGTAGHVDHGKSSLVRALTGTDPDRWIEERLRGMTLDLGFAHLRYDDGVEAGIVDVPGHERFLHNMLAGAAGMEVLLLVVAANEGAKPQTLEHLAILRYLNVRRTIVVHSKADTVAAEELGFAAELLREALAGTIADGAPILPVSALTGAGLDALRDEIHAALAALPPRSPGAPAYLPVDRVFALPGHGTIVTGTLMQGRIATGETLALTPLGRTVRVRGLHVFGTKRDAVDGGSRVAVNVPGVETHEIARGAVLASPQFAMSARLAVAFTPVAGVAGMLKRRTPVRAYLGAAEILGTLAFDAIPNGTDGVRATLHLREPVVAFPGAAFVVRRLSPKTLLGGGTVAALISVTAVAASGDDAIPETIAAALRAAGIAGAHAARIGATANVREDAAAAFLERMVECGRAWRLQKPPAFVDAGLAQDAIARAGDRLRANEAATPWIVGTTALALARALDVPEPLLARLLATAVADGTLASRQGYFASPDFVPVLAAEQRAFFDRIFGSAERGAFAPVPADDVHGALRSAKIVGLAQALETLLASGALVKVHDAFYRGEQIAEIRARLETALRREKQLTMAAFRDVVGTSRKFAVPLLEWFDATGVTLRSGDVRVLRASGHGQVPRSSA